MTTYIAKVEQQLSCQIMSIRSDNGRGFSSAAWNTYEVPFAPHAQNGRVERVHLVTVLRRPANRLNAQLLESATVV